MKSFETIEELAEVAKHCVDEAEGRAHRRYVATGTRKPAYIHLKERQKNIIRSWHVISDAPAGMSRQQQLFHAGLRLVGDNPNNPENWILPEHRQIL